jgi:hypothetical protein
MIWKKVNSHKLIKMLLKMMKKEKIMKLNL